MDPAMLFGATVGVMFFVCFLAARWYVVPVLARTPLADAMVPLLLTHATRVVGLAFLAPAVVDPNLPREIAVPAAVGDCVAAGLALAAAAAFRAGWGIAVPLAWAMNVAGGADLVYVSVRGAMLDFPGYKLGATWFIPTVLGPVMMVSHGLMFWLLVRHRSESAAPQWSASSGPPSENEPRPAAD